MNQNLNLHIGYHKTGTTSLQRCLSSRENTFNYLGRRYDNSIEDEEINALARAVALNHQADIERIGSSICEMIKSQGYVNNLISHENLLRPSNSSFSGLNKIISIFERHFVVKVFVSVRDENELILSRFSHDLMRLGGPKRSKLIPFALKKLILKRALCNEFDCLYPYCNDVNQACGCGLVKRIPVSLYDEGLLQKRIKAHLHFVDILHSGSSGLVFDDSVFPLPKLNVARLAYSRSQKTALLKIIDEFLAGFK